jgi:hypothetical protein
LFARAHQSQANGFALAMTLLGTDDVALFERVEEVVP